ncbi:heavy metal-binding domain-containing protein [bacterium]|nr:heavy metal-binding domain-containing protein [bacterium]
MAEFIIWIAILLCCFSLGIVIEHFHIKDIRKREIKLYKSPYITFAKNINAHKKVKKAQLVASTVVLGADLLRVVFAKFINFFGGNISLYEKIADRARREAILRIREQANKMQADIVVNIKIETIRLNSIDDRNSQPRLSVLVSGTAIQYEK